MWSQPVTVASDQGPKTGPNRTLKHYMPVSTQWWTFLSYLCQEYSKQPIHPSSIEVVNAIHKENWAQPKDDPETFLKAFAAKFHADNSRNGRTNGRTPHSHFKCETVGPFFCYLFLLFSLSSPTYATASTCSQGVNTLILFNVLD